MAEVDGAFTSSAGRSTRNEGWARSAASFCHSLEGPAKTRSTKRSRQSRKYCASPLILERRTDAAGGIENSDVHNPTRAKQIVERGRDRSGGPSADRRWAQVPMSSNKFTSCSRKRQEGFKSANDPSDVAILGMAVDSQSLFRRSVPRLLPRRENEPAEAAAIEATSRHGEQHSISIGTMDFREASPLKFLLIPATFWHRLARCKLTKPRLEGYFTNACAVWTT